MTRRLLWAVLLTAIFTPQSHADTAVTYQKTCGVCHDAGSLNAPKKGDKATWQRLNTQKGMPALIKSTKDGMAQMPAMGLCNTCTDAEFKALIDYMSQ